MNTSSRNRTLRLSPSDRERLDAHILSLPISAQAASEPGMFINRVCQGDFRELLPHLPEKCVDLLFIDPPYNLTKQFNDYTFRRRNITEYMQWMDGWMGLFPRILKDTASIYICGDWRSSSAIHMIADKHFRVRNRITFEREKGRGARRDWKNNSEDIWFCTMNDEYTFQPDAVRLKRQVIAPYKLNGTPRDWQDESDGKYRLTAPSNLWTDLTMPFWSMPENTPHPTQKPEKLLAKILLASSRPGDTVFDPFSGAGTTATVARKLKRNFISCELDREYCLYTLRRLELAESDGAIQGYHDGVFWERNTLRRNRMRKANEAIKPAQSA